MNFQRRQCIALQGVWSYTLSLPAYFHFLQIPFALLTDYLDEVQIVANSSVDLLDRFDVCNSGASPLRLGRVDMSPPGPQLKWNQRGQYAQL